METTTLHGTQIADIFAECSIDYDKTSQITRDLWELRGILWKGSMLLGM